jgi:hypothetical protein
VIRIMMIMRMCGGEIVGCSGFAHCL